MDPAQFETAAIISLVLAGLCCLIILADLLTGHPQKMGVMNIVWPVTALYAGPLALVLYYSIGRKSTVYAMHEKPSSPKENRNRHEPANKPMHHMQEKPFWQSVVSGTLHCGAGCTLGDITAEFGLLLFPPFFLWGKRVFGNWVVDFCVAFLLGIIFQYFAIKPMKNLSPPMALKAAVKADTLSLTCWQVGMYGWMAIAFFLLFRQELSPTNPVFWLMMQAGMILGFFTAFPVNWWLIKSGIKEKM